jgi:hypothetical protein
VSVIPGTSSRDPRSQKGTKDRRVGEAAVRQADAELHGEQR